MSELKGTLLTIILVLILFGTMSACLTKAFSDMSNKVTNEVTEVMSELD